MSKKWGKVRPRGCSEKAYFPKIIRETLNKEQSRLFRWLMNGGKHEETQRQQ